MDYLNQGQSDVESRESSLKREVNIRVTSVLQPALQKQEDPSLRLETRLEKKITNRETTTLSRGLSEIRNA